MSQVDLLASLAMLTGQKLRTDEGPDSQNMLQQLLGKSQQDREYLVQHAGTLALVKGDWKYIAPSNGAVVNEDVHIELGNLPQPQLYYLPTDIGEIDNVARQHPQIVKEMASLLESIKKGSR